MQHYHQGIIHLPSRPGTIPAVQDIQVLRSLEPVVEETGAMRTLQLHLCSYNAMTLKEGLPTDPEGIATLATPAKMECLLRQMHESEVTIFGIQETRLPMVRRSADPRYFLYNSAATANGHAGVMIGLARDRPIGHTEERTPVYLQDKDVGILHADPRRLVLRISAPALKCVVLACHAPHSGQSIDEIAQWWEVTSRCIPKKVQDWPLILLVGANARVGGHPSQHIGSLDAEDGGDKAEPFEDVVVRHNLILPSTHAEHHEGPSTTWTHARGQESRIDYVGVPMHWATTALQSWVQSDFETPLPRDDHRPVHVQAEFVTYLPLKHHPGRARQKSYELNSEPDLSRFSLAPEVSWTLAVHQHAEALQQELVTSLQSTQATGTRRPMRTTMSEATWDLVLEKRQWRHHLAEANRLQRHSILRSCFAAWGSRTAYDARQQQQLQRLQGEHDRLVATALQTFRSAA